MQDFDVVVVGAGPGGSNAASVALARGLSVAQVERYPFPRVKACGGGMTIKACKSVRAPLSPVELGQSFELQFNVWGIRQNCFSHVSAPVIRMVHRPEFDAYLVNHNKRQPRFSFFDNERVVNVEYDGVFHVHTASRVIRGRHLVGADGAYSIVNKLFQVSTPKGHAVAVEVVIDRRYATLQQESPPCFDFGATEAGYGWIFPKRDHWNVGLYSLVKQKDLREQLRAYIAQKGFILNSDPFSTFEGHQFPYGGYRLTVPDAPVYMVGDAAGFGDPIMGEGIYHALESGRIAGETIGDCFDGSASHSDYYHRIKSRVLNDTFVTYQIGKEFYRNVDKAVTILENPFVWRPLMEGYSRGSTFTDVLKKGSLLLGSSLIHHTLKLSRHGSSLPWSLWGPLRGLPYLMEPLFTKSRQRIGVRNENRNVQ